jgi:hypothetical protein
VKLNLVLAFYAAFFIPPLRSLLTSYAVPSRQMANRIPASFRASATAAIRLPRLAAMRSAHSRSGAVAGCFARPRMHQAASTSSQRVRLLPCFVM